MARTRKPEPGEITGRELLARRLDLGLSQTACAELLQIDRKTYMHWENGKHPVTHPRMVDLAMCELERRMRKSNAAEKQAANKGILPSKGGNMDRYEWRERQQYPLVVHLMPLVDANNDGICRACIIQTGKDRFVVNEQNVALKINATYTGFKSAADAKRFVERFEDLQCGESGSDQPSRDSLEFSLSVSS